MVVFIDIDGTVAHIGERLKKAGPEPKERGPAFSKWLKSIQNKKSLLEDRSVLAIRLLFHALRVNHRVYFLTGRSEIYREVTQEWLGKEGLGTCFLIMRPKGNRQSAGQFKEEAIQTRCIRGQEVLVIDDDFNGEVQKVCARNGWTFLKAMSGGTFDQEGK